MLEANNLRIRHSIYYFSNTVSARPLLGIVKLVMLSVKFSNSCAFVTLCGAHVSNWEGEGGYCCYIHGWQKPGDLGFRGQRGYLEVKSGLLLYGLLVCSLLVGLTCIENPEVTSGFLSMPYLYEVYLLGSLALRNLGLKRELLV